MIGLPNIWYTPFSLPSWHWVVQRRYLIMSGTSWESDASVGMWEKKSRYAQYLTRHSPISLESFIGYGVSFVHRFRVSYLLNLSLLGIYDLALLINSAIIFIIWPFAIIPFPKLSKMYGLWKNGKWRIKYQRYLAHKRHICAYGDARGCAFLIDSTFHPKLCLPVSINTGDFLSHNHLHVHFWQDTSGFLFCCISLDFDPLDFAHS